MSAKSYTVSKTKNFTASDDMRKSLFIVIAILLSSTMYSAERISLDGKWTLDFWEQGRIPVTSPSQMTGLDFKTIDAYVPGNVELDLYAAGLIENPEIGSAVYRLRYLEGYQWRYSRQFTTPSFGIDDSVILDFEGIDCFAEIYVNGKHIGSTDNMLIAHRFDVTDVLNPKGQDNTLEVIIRSSVEEGRKEIPPTFSNNWQRPETVYIRRAPHSYGWDIMPRLVSAGLWRSVFVEVEHPVHIRDTHWMTGKVDVKTSTAQVILDYTVSFPVKYQSDGICIKVELSRKGRKVFEQKDKLVMHSKRIRFHLDNVDFWWPRGYGEPALYDAKVTLLTSDGKILDENVRKIGIRTIQLDMSETSTKDNPGRFHFIVNGEPVFIHGSNWVPLDALHSRDPQHVDKTVALAVDLNCNMLRCWGGNVYEDTHFYDLCDENGIMVWQDFTMGCSFYPQTEEFQRRLEKELYYIIRKLRSHPCIALWAGNNEDDEMIATDGGFALYRPDPNRDKVSRVTIPNVLYELDPTRSYLPSSPYWSPGVVRDYFSITALPERHLWGPRGYYKAPFYTTEADNLFVSETGYHGMPNRESLEKMFPPESVYPWTDKSNYHWNDDWICKSVSEFEEYGYNHSRNDLMTNQVRILFGEVPSNLDEFILASQCVQAEADKFFVERFRGNKFSPRTGILWWNIRDGWPILSDAVVDWYFSPKLAYYFIRNVQHNVCVMMLDAENGSHPLVVSNDTRMPCGGSVSVKDMASGKTVFEGKYEVDANGRSVIAGIPQKDGQGMYLITYTAQDGKTLKNHYLYGNPPFKLDQYEKWLKSTGIYDL